MTKTRSHQAKPRGNPGRRLQKARRQLKLTQSDVAQRLKVPISAIKYLDRWELDSIDSKFRTKSTVRQYALLVGLNPGLFEAAIPYEQPKRSGLGPMVVLTRLSLSTLAVLISLTVLGFLAWRTFVATARPVLVVHQPSPGEITDQPTAAISGQTSERAQVYVNGFNVPVDPSGNFDTSVILEEGPNTITVTAINSFGRQAEDVRLVEYRP